MNIVAFIYFSCVATPLPLSDNGHCDRPRIMICNTPATLRNINHRDQNFGLNELAAVQDVRNEFSLQDIADEPAVDRGKVYARVANYES